jgi:hypothetical protein
MTVETDQTGSSPVLLHPPVPPRAIFISLVALIVAGVGSLLWPDRLRDAAGLAAAMVVLIGLQPFSTLVPGRPVNWRVAGVTAGLFVAVSFGAGVSTELLHRQAFNALQLAYADPLAGLGNRRVGD